MHQIWRIPGKSGNHGEGETTVSRAAAVATVRWTRVFLGQADQVSRARRELARHLTACRFTRTDDAILVLSELASNAILHSASAGASITVRTELFPAYLWIETEDLGGEWHLKLPEDRMHGLGLVEALTGPDGWGVDDGEHGRVVWARLELDGQ
jgi:anti-sigma regulatory factor (Ser/Thr protein kinase)